MKFEITNFSCAPLDGFEHPSGRFQGKVLLGSRVLLGLSYSCQALHPHLLLSVSEYTVINEACPGAEWNIMCRECCEYDQIKCECPGKKEVVGYTIPCCRNEENECDSCLIHPGECVLGDLGSPPCFLRSLMEAGRMLEFWQVDIRGCDAIMIKSGITLPTLNTGRGLEGLVPFSVPNLQSCGFIYLFVHWTNRLRSPCILWQVLGTQCFRKRDIPGISRTCSLVGEMEE